MEKIELIDFKQLNNNYDLMYKWCNQEFIYEWFEQKKLSKEEIINKYKNKLESGKQNLFIINFNDIPIGYTQIYKYDDTIFKGLEEYNNIYEFDTFIGEEDYLSKGIGTKIVNYICEYIYKNYNADCIVLRPFKRNIRAIKCYEKNIFRTIHEYDSTDTVGNKEKVVVLIKGMK